ncbi:MAG: lysostaphin resistance A-like protein [Calditrichia bacterium]
MNIRNIFFNKEEQRLRAGWRIILFLVAVMACSWAIILPLMWFIGGRPAPGLGRDFLLIGAAAIIVTLLLPVARKRLDKRSLVSLGLHFDANAIKDLIFGCFLSAAMAATFFFLLIGFGKLEITGFAWQVEGFLLSLLGYLALHIIVGWWEELFFRGYLFDNMKAGLGLTWAIVTSCLLYGLMHAANPNSTLLSSGIIVIFGFLRIYGLIATRQLWLSMGMHMGWNFFQGPIFGFAASGHTTVRLVEHQTNGADWLTGGEFGPEGSVLILPILAAALLAMHLWAKITRPTESSQIFV